MITWLDRERERARSALPPHRRQQENLRLIGTPEDAGRTLTALAEAGIEEVSLPLPAWDAGHRRSSPGGSAGVPLSTAAELPPLGTKRLIAAARTVTVQAMFRPATSLVGPCSGGWRNPNCTGIGGTAAGLVWRTPTPAAIAVVALRHANRSPRYAQRSIALRRIGAMKWGHE